MNVGLDKQLNILLPILGQGRLGHVSYTCPMIINTPYHLLCRIPLKLHVRVFNVRTLHVMSVSIFRETYQQNANLQQTLLDSEIFIDNKYCKNDVCRTTCSSWVS